MLFPENIGGPPLRLRVGHTIKMIKEIKIDENQDVYARRVYVVRPKKELLDLILSIDPTCKDEIDLYNRPTVVMTEDVPFEREIEGWRGAIESKCKEAFLRDNIYDFPLFDMDKPENLLIEMDILIQYFDKWWVIEEADDYIEIIKGSWKTRKCFGVKDD